MRISELVTALEGARKFLGDREVVFSGERGFFHDPEPDYARYVDSTPLEGTVHFLLEIPLGPGWRLED